MINVPVKTKERAMLVALHTNNVSRHLVDEHLLELEELADTAGADTVFKVVQSKNNFDPAYYIGKGKAEELAQLVELDNIELVIFDDDLSSVQVRNLERMFDRKIVDRSGLILDIFATHAKTSEAKTQVELAQLQYMLPRLTRAWTHLSKQYGGIGTKGPGETQIETDRRIIRTRISHLKENLKKIETRRKTQSISRKKSIRVSLAGYTNAGKSTLFNLLTASDVFAEDKLFATLDSTTRVLEINSTRKILLSDTVGFIRKLPPHLVASFKSTLNEVREADIILHIVDMSHLYYEDHLDVVSKTLKEFGSEKKTEILVFNKVDAVEDKSKIDLIRNSYNKSVVISAQKGINISKLIEEIKNAAEQSYMTNEISLPISATKLAAQIHSIAEVVSIEYEDDIVKIKFRGDREKINKINKLISDVKPKRRAV